MAYSGGVGISHGVAPAPVPPAPASGAGFNTLTLNDHFTSTSTIDLTDSRALGFNWYIHQAWPLATATGGWATFPKTKAADLTVSGSILTITNTDATVYADQSLNTAAATGTGSTYVGNAFSGGFYIEVRAKFDPSLATTGINSWPGWWSASIECLIGTQSHFGELDFFEAIPTGAGTIETEFAVHDWVTPAGSNSNTNAVADLSGTDWSVFHTYGTLWVPAAKNGGTGLIQRYFDGTHLTAQDVSYTASGPASPGASPSNPNGTFSIFDSQSPTIMLGCGPNWPTQYDYVQVWQ